MDLKIGVVRNVQIEEVLSKKFNLFMGISLNNKWFTKENIKEYILWGLKYTKSKFGIVIADTLQVINYEVQGKYSKKASIRKALKEGSKIIDIIQEILKELDLRSREKIDIIRWVDIKDNHLYKKDYKVFLSEFETNIEFKNTIKEIIKEFLIRKNKSLDNEKLEKLCLYVIDELPELINGFTFKGTNYNCFLYPYDGTLTRLVEDIQKRKFFLDLYNKLSLEGKGNGFIELR